jgi:hypothetical protein
VQQRRSSRSARVELVITRAPLSPAASYIAVILPRRLMGVGLTISDSWTLPDLGALGERRPVRATCRAWPIRGRFHQ